MRLLNANKKHADVQAALTAYMQNRPKMIQPWMYDALAQSIKLNRGREEDVKLYLGYAADAAKISKNPTYLVSAADMLFLNGDYGRVGPLLDEAMVMVPHEANPMIMSLNLALKTKDPKRMADSAEKLLALGWPGQDDRVRGDTRRMVEALAKSLREGDRSHEADELLNHLAESEARDIYIRLTWQGDAGFDLVVDEPFEATARYSAPRTVLGGSIIKSGYGKHPEDVYVCPRAFDGEYGIRIQTLYNNPEKPASNVTLEIILHEGTAQESKEKRVITAKGDETGPIVVKLAGGRRKTTLPFITPRFVVPHQMADPKPGTPKAKDAPSQAKGNKPESR